MPAASASQLRSSSRLNSSRQAIWSSAFYKAAYGDATGSSTFPSAHQLSVPIIRFNEFLPDTQQISSGVIVGQAGWETQLENNKQAFAAEFVQRSRFRHGVSHDDDAGAVCRQTLPECRRDAHGE